MRFHPGAIVIANPFTDSGQLRWIKQALTIYPSACDFLSNLDSEWKYPSPRSEIDWWKSANGKLEHAPIWKLRWVTFGYHHDWNTKVRQPLVGSFITICLLKVYSEAKKSPFPDDVGRLSSVFAAVLGYPHFAPQAAIVNFYHLSSTLGIHQDISEPYTEAPLISVR